MVSRPIYIIPLIHDWNWTGSYQRYTALELRKTKSSVLLIENHKEPVNIRRFLHDKSQLIKTGEGGVIFIRLFHLLPFERFSIIYWLNQRLSILLLGLWIKKHYKKAKIVVPWIHHPRDVWILSSMKLWFWFHIVSLYDNADYFVLDKGKISRQLLKSERLLLQKVEIVIAASQKLLQRLKIQRPDAKYVDPGFIIPDKKVCVRNIGLKPNDVVIGYVGGVNNRLDYRLLLNLSKTYQDWKFVLWGPIQNTLFEDDAKTYQLLQKLLKQNNVITGKSSSYEETLGVIANFSVAIIPYDTNNAFNQYCNPIKLYEYFYMGKPVVSSNIQEVTYYNRFVVIANSTAEWKLALEKQINNKLSKATKQDQKQISLANSWKNRISKITALIESYENA